MQDVKQKNNSKEHTTSIKSEKKKSETKTSPGLSTDTTKCGPSTKQATSNKRGKYPGLTKSVNSRFRREYMDQDYVEQLSHEEKQWLSNFMEEYMSGNVNHEGETLHKSKEELRECYGRNNARNRDIYNHKRAKGHLMQADTRILDLYDKEQVDNADNQEDVQIEITDKKVKLPVKKDS